MYNTIIIVKNRGLCTTSINCTHTCTIKVATGSMQNTQRVIDKQQEEEKNSKSKNGIAA